MLSEAPPPPGLLRKALLKPEVAWLPRRSRKLLPRSLTALPADALELIMVGVGLGVGKGVGVGIGVGVGVGVGVCACTDVGTAATAPAKATASICTSQRPAPVLPAREGRDEPRMNSIPKKATPARKKAQIPPTAAVDLRPVTTKRQ